MAERAPRTRLRLAPLPGGRGLLVLLAALSLLTPRAARAEDDGIYYSPKLTFRIPFQLDANGTRISQVLLHVSDDEGRAWQNVATANPGDRGFTFTARRDGWYWFTVQTMDQERQLFPPRVEGAAPGLRVLVDTIAPEVKLRPLPGVRAGQGGVEWDLRDAALDLNTIRLEYRAPGQFWQDVRGVQRNASGLTRWDVTTPGAVEVRLQVKDKAGNLGEGTTRIRAEGGRPMDRADEPPPANPDEHTPANVRKINSTRISLNYKIDDVGPSDISVVEIWKTRDGRLWQRHPKDADKKPPFVVEVEGEGRYGFSLVAKSGVGLGEQAPRPGDEPQIWIEVDLTKPVVRIVDVVVGRGADTGNLTVTWSATDRNLARQPISLSYATRPEGPWTPVPGATSIEHAGRHSWRMQSDVPFEFHVRVEAADEAGNVGQATTQQTVKVDLALPKARVIGVEPVKPGVP